MYSIHTAKSNGMQMRILLIDRKDRNMKARDKNRLASRSWLSLCEQTRDIEYPLNNPSLREKTRSVEDTSYKRVQIAATDRCVIVLSLNYDTSVTRERMYLISGLMVHAIRHYTTIDFAEGP